MAHEKNILVPIDLHENAGPVVQWAAFMARVFHRRLVLLHANESLAFLNDRPGLHGGGFPGLDLTIDKWQERYRKESKAELDRITNAYCRDLSVSFLIHEGRASDCISQAISSSDSDMIVMGTHGRPWYTRVFLGSTADAVLRTSRVPVLIIHNSVATTRVPRFQRLLYTTDFSPASQASDAWLNYLARTAKSDVTLLHAIDNPLLDTYDPEATVFDFKQEGDDARDHPPRSAQPYWIHAKEVAQAKLYSLRQQLYSEPFPASHVDIAVEEGHAAEVILQVAELQDSDVIVMATHGRSGVQHLLLGSVTEKVLHVTQRPVLAVPSRSAA